MENLVILDTETTGLDPESAQIIEIAAIHYHVPTRTIIQQISSLITASSNEAYEVNGISIDALKSTDHIAGIEALCFVEGIIDRCDAVVAHNAEFDRAFIAKRGIFPKKWICSKDDFDWPVRPGTPLNLIHIAVDLGVPVVSAHRALTDCQLLASCFNKISDLEDRLAETQQPKSICIANVNYDDRQLAKDAGFSWNAQAKRRERKLTRKRFEELKSICKFSIIGNF